MFFYNSISNNGESWQELLTIASKPLLDNGNISDLYVNNIIKDIGEYGTYSVVSPLIWLAHSKAGKDYGVNSTAISVLLCQNPFNLIDKDVKIIILLASFDSSSHLSMLGKLSSVLDDEDLLNKMLNTNDINDIRSILS